jgi:hypothetical protein
MGGYRRAGDFLFRGRYVRPRRRAGDIDWGGADVGIDDPTNTSVDTSGGEGWMDAGAGGSDSGTDLGMFGTGTGAGGGSDFPLALPDIGGGIQRLLGGGGAAAAVGSAAAAGMSAAVPSSLPKTVKRLMKHITGTHHRRMNPGNFKALRRSMRRLKAFEHAAKRVYAFTHARPGKSHFKFGRRKRR